MDWKIAASLALAALPGVAATAWLALPVLVDPAATSVPLPTLQVAAALQGTMLVLIAVVVGTWAAPKVGVSAPVIAAIGSGRGVLAALRPQLAPGIVGGCLGAAIIVGFHAFAPAALRGLQAEVAVPLAVRVLYGGITEEVLIRWGSMTAIAWVGWKILQRELRQPSAAVMWSAIVASALLFGVAHLPAAAQSLPALSGAIVAYVTLGNALFGMVAGYLFWRYGLEAAIVAHVAAHLLAFVVRG
jgi:membrane protease YdiL (CAAX protease family)